MSNLHFHYGTMGTSKSADLIMNAFNFRKNKVNVECIKPAFDNRFSENEIKSRVGISTPAISIPSLKDYKPKKETAIAFAIALELNLDETLDFIGRAGFTLTHSSKFDIIIEYFLMEENYNIFEINEALYEFDQPLLGV